MNACNSLDMIELELTGSSNLQTFDLYLLSVSDIIQRCSINTRKLVLKKPIEKLGVTCCELGRTVLIS